jgi:cobyrinic acid a,c-diamide synthase
MNKYLAGRLARFRARLEHEAEQPIGELEVNAALLLLDLCRHLGLVEAQSVRVLEANNSAMVSSLAAERQIETVEHVAVSQTEAEFR